LLTQLPSGQTSGVDPVQASCRGEGHELVANWQEPSGHNIGNVAGQITCDGQFARLMEQAPLGQVKGSELGHWITLAALQSAAEATHAPYEQRTGCAAGQTGLEGQREAAVCIVL